MERNRRSIEEKNRALLKILKISAVAAMLMVSTSASVLAMPQDGQISSGCGTIAQQGSTMTVTQSSERLGINWNHFGILAGEKVNFMQPGAGSVVLNRVVGNDPSAIYGQITANGQVFLVNPNGILFAPGSQVNVGGLVASTLNITDQDFAAGRYVFRQGGVIGTTINEGSLRAANGGYIVLAGQQAANTGAISATGGTVALGAAGQLAMDLPGNGIINLAVDAATVNAAVINSGHIEANGGQVLLTGRSGDAVLAAVVNNTGIIEAKRISTRDGMIRLDGGTNGTVSNAGTLDASGIEAGQTGGTVKVLGDQVSLLSGSVIDASGDQGGGTVLVGGNRQGEGLEQNAATTYMDKNATVKADALTNGDGGKIIIWANNNTEFNGAVSAIGGSQVGNGGFVETSAAHLKLGTGASVNAGAPKGNGGEWLIDPYNYTIDAAAAGNIVSALNTGTGVTVSTQGANASYGGSASGAGDITVSSAITKSGGGDATLRLLADQNIIVNSNITSTTGKLNLTLSAANASGAATGGVNINGNLTSNGGNILIGGGTGTRTKGIGFARNLDANSAAVLIGADKAIRSNGGNITINGHSSIDSGSGSYSGTTSGIYILSGAQILSGTGDLFMTGQQSGGIKTFGLAFEANAPTTIGTASDGGHMVIDAVNTSTGTQAEQDASALGLTNNDGRANIIFQSPSVANWFIKLNGNGQNVTYANPAFPATGQWRNVGELNVPGANGDYLCATYQVVDQSTQAIYVVAGSGSKTYDGTTAATGVPLTTIGAPTGFSTGGLAFSTSSKNAAAYDYLIGDPTNPTHYNGANYAIGYYNTGTYTIHPKSLTPTVSSKVYDGAANVSVTASGLLKGDSVTLSGTGNFPSANVGDYPNISITGITLSGSDAGNYSLASTDATASASITPATLTYTANSASRIYGDTNPAFSGTITGWQGSDNQSSATTGTLTWTSSATQASDVGNYSINGGGLTSNNGNYVFAQAADNAAAMTVTKRPATITVSNTSKIYGNADPGWAYALSGVASVDNGFSGGLGREKGENVGSYAFYPTETFQITRSSVNKTANYDITFRVPTFIITKRPITVTAAPYSKVYDGTLRANVTPAITGGSLLYSDKATLSEVYADKNAGTGKALIPTAVINDGNGGNNYAVTYVNNNSGSISQAPLTITAAANTKTYDGGLSAFATPTYSGLQTGDSISGLTEAYTDKNAGTGKTLTVTGYSIGDGNSGGNYTVSTVNNTTGVINQKELTLKPSVQDKTYDGTTAATVTDYGLSGLVGSETVGISSIGAAFSDKNAGDGKIVTISGISLQGGTNGGLASNYSVVSTGIAAADISKAALTYKANPNTRNTGAVNPVFSGTVNGFVNNETLADATSGTLQWTTTANAASPIGSYAIYGSGLTAENYYFVQHPNNAAALKVEGLPPWASYSIDVSKQKVQSGNLVTPLSSVLTSNPKKIPQGPSIDINISEISTTVGGSDAMLTVTQNGVDTHYSTSTGLDGSFTLNLENQDSNRRREREGVVPVRHEGTKIPVYLKSSSAATPAGLYNISYSESALTLIPGPQDVPSPPEVTSVGTAGPAFSVTLPNGGIANFIVNTANEAVYITPHNDAAAESLLQDGRLSKQVLATGMLIAVQNLNILPDQISAVFVNRG